MLDKFIVAKYLRLSLDDGDDAESDSISNQRHLIDYNIGKMFNSRDIETIELSDDGYTGTNFNRPGIKKLLILAETGGINCIIVKDFSRFARDYIELGLYMEQKFPLWNIRFISINDNYDSADYLGITGGMDIAFKNITYTMYSRDLSEKIKSAKNVLGKKGKFISPYAFFGYSKSSEDKRKLVIDPVAAEIVKRIYGMRAEGTKITQIAAILNQEHVPTPSTYKKSLNPVCRDWNNNYPYWTANNLREILTDERYTGKMISNKTERPIVGHYKSRRKDKSQWLVVENTHEAIISQELFDSVQNKTPRKKSVPQSKSILTGLVKCGCCHHSVRCMVSKKGVVKYACHYKQYSENNNCFSGYIFEQDVIAYVSKVIWLEIEKAVDVQQVMQAFNSVSKKKAHNIKEQDRLIEAEKRKKVENYIALTTSKLSEEEFTKRQNTINAKIAECEKIKKSLQTEIPQENLSSYELFSKYIGIEEVNSEVIHDLVKTIYLYPDNRVEIVWNYSDKVI